MSWKRVECGAIDGELTEATEARIADPLWMLGRQWQVGEFKGEDAASPVIVEAEFEHAPITRLRLGPPDGRGPVLQRERGGLPLEAAVEREPLRTGPAAARLAAEAGLQLWRLMDTAGAPPTLKPPIRTAFALRLPPDDGLDPTGRAELALLARRSFDAPRLHRAYADATAAGKPLPRSLQAPELAGPLAAWSSWYAALLSEPAGGSAWDPRRMSYRFQVAAGVSAATEVQLDADEYLGGHLDWHAFDVARRPVEMGARGTLEGHDLRVIPTPARFAGQAASRWWQVEGAKVWFPDLHVAPEDLARVAVASFGAVYGDDWFLVPIRLPAGVLVRAGPVRVLDTMGEVHRIRSCAELDGPGRPWRFFELTGDTAADAELLRDRACPWLLLPPALPGVVQSRPLEEVLLQRDEAANLGWASELRVESQAGRSVDRAARAHAALKPPAAPEGDAWRYRLAPQVAEHRLPLVPVRSADRVPLLQRGRLAEQARGAAGRILEPGRQLLLHDDAVPASGARVTRSWQLARTADGGVTLWVGRRNGPAGPRRVPGLTFDDVLRPRRAASE
jgi:hypothetical protein